MGRKGVTDDIRRQNTDDRHLEPLIKQFAEYSVTAKKGGTGMFICGMTQAGRRVICLKVYLLLNFEVLISESELQYLPPIFIGARKIIHF